MDYFRKTYVNNVHFTPTRWLHLHDKEFMFYDPTNNTSESLNNVIKRGKDKAFTLKMTTLKIVDEIKQTEFKFDRLGREHGYKKSLKCSQTRKLNREKEVQKEIKEQSKIYQDIFEYKI